MNSTRSPDLGFSITPSPCTAAAFHRRHHRSETNAQPSLDSRPQGNIASRQPPRSSQNIPYAQPQPSERFSLLAVTRAGCQDKPTARATRVGGNTQPHRHRGVPRRRHWTRADSWLRVFGLFPQARTRALASADHGSVAELTDDDVREMKQFLADTCTDVKRWLPEPEWCPGWQSEAAGRGNDERGPDGLWGPDVVRSVYVGRRRCSCRRSCRA